MLSSIGEFVSEVWDVNILLRSCVTGLQIEDKCVMQSGVDVGGHWQSLGHVCTKMVC